ncbi:MAG: hypothetical protein II822_10490 [Prevotella sp.]|nr:hypothetical protein [Prevotella sp.]
MKRYCVLSYIFDGYEVVHEVLNPDPEAEYVMVTDDPQMKSDTWRVVYDESLMGLSTFDKCYRVRFRPFNYTDADIVVRIDGSLQVTNPFTPIIDEFERGQYDLCVMIHPERNNIEKEYDVWVKARNYPRSQADKCISYMRKQGYDFNYKGLYEGAFTIHRRNKFNLQFCKDVFDLHLKLGSNGKIERLDQTLTSFVLNTKYRDKVKVMAVSRRIIHDGEFLQMYYHNSYRRMPIVVPMIMPYVFDKVVNVWK